MRAVKESINRFSIDEMVKDVNSFLPKNMELLRKGPVFQGIIKAISSAVCLRLNQIYYELLNRR